MLYLGIKAGLKTITFDRDTIITLVGRFILGPLVMFVILTVAAKNIPAVEFKTFVVQSSAPALAVLPILANQGDGDLTLPMQYKSCKL